ncbi:MAG: signal peptidase II [Acidobacteriota bacterium]|nr:signal peptidase II [Acidobacteriota bacterium]
MNLRVRSAIIILLVVMLDRVSKLYIRSSYAPWDVTVVIPRIFNIVHAENPGAAFSMLASAPPIVRAVLLVGVSMLVMTVVGVMLWRLPKTASALTSTSLALVFGGAFGNLWDRVFRGSVTDFLQVFLGSYEFPSFNVADSAITMGAALLILDLLRTRNTTAP